MKTYTETQVKQIISILLATIVETGIPKKRSKKDNYDALIKLADGFFQENTIANLLIGFNKLSVEADQGLF